ncbi:MAG: hypothetical protein JW951_02475, partial [Lentisphaerae bacterium]|nr:hypothetical protein [Lentisphaerota bacterium]
MKTGYGFVLFCGAVAALCAAAPAGRAAGITQRFEDDFTTYMNEEDIVTSPDWIRVQAFTLTGYAGSSASVYEAARDAVQFNSGAAGQSACLHTNESCGDGGFRVETGIMLVNEDKRGGLVFNWTPASDSDTDVSGYLFQYMQIAGADSNLVRLLKYDAADEVTDGLAPELDGSKVTEVMPWIKLEGFADIAEANANTWITLAAESDGDGGFRLDVRQKIHGWSTNITDTGTPLTGGYVGFGTQR